MRCELRMRAMGKARRGARNSAGWVGCLGVPSLSLVGKGGLGFSVDRASETELVGMESASTWAEIAAVLEGLSGN